MSSSKTGAPSSEGSDGVDAPRRHRCAKVEVLKLTSGRRPPHQYLYISTTYMSHANLCDFACLIAASPSSCSLDSSKSFSNGLIGTFGTMNQASITMPPLEYAFQRGRMLFRYGCLKSCNSCSPNFPLSIAGKSPRRKARRSRRRRSSAGDQKKRPDLNETAGRSTFLSPSRRPRDDRLD